MYYELSDLKTSNYILLHKLLCIFCNCAPFLLSYELIIFLGSSLKSMTTSLNEIASISYDENDVNVRFVLLFIMFFISYSLLANSGDMSVNLRNILLILGTADFLHANPNFVQDQTEVQELYCNKDTGGLKAYHSWSRARLQSVASVPPIFFSGTFFLPRNFFSTDFLYVLRP